jgi:midasin
MILGVAQHWEEFAHSKISLVAELEAVTRLVIGYRKLELDSWKHSLDTVAHDARVSASRWWFHLYSVVDEIASDHW